MFVSSLGLSIRTISAALVGPRSVVYSTLKELRRLGFVFTYPRDKAPSGMRKKRYVCERTTWGKYGIRAEFLTALNLEGIVQRVQERLREPLLEVLGEVWESFQGKRELRGFIPSQGEGSICPRCDRSHEAMEFFYAILLKAIDSFITESSEFREFLAKRGYSR
jgi:hypothetical protein